MSAARIIAIPTQQQVQVARVQTIEEQGEQMTEERRGQTTEDRGQTIEGRQDDIKALATRRA